MIGYVCTKFGWILEINGRGGGGGLNQSFRVKHELFTCLPDHAAHNTQNKSFPGQRMEQALSKLLRLNSIFGFLNGMFHQNQQSGRTFENYKTLNKKRRKKSFHVCLCLLFSIKMYSCNLNGKQIEGSINLQRLRASVEIKTMRRELNYIRFERI